MKITFDVKHLYYLPQYMPVYQALCLKPSVECNFLFYQQPDDLLNQVCQQIVIDEKLNASWVDSWSDALNFYQQQAANWIVFGNAIDDLDRIHQFSKTALMEHGIGPKQCYYDVSESNASIRFVEGQHRLKRLLALYPNNKFYDSGYAKLDPAFNNANPALANLSTLGLDENKKTLLYAPTFYPSSLECLARDFPTEFAEYNIIVKPHFFSLTKHKYKKHQVILNDWAQASNVYVAPVSSYNLVPLMQIADVMISDASSAMFEFAALNKPVVWCDFYKLRWSYRGIFSFRFKQRLDDDIKFFHQICHRAGNYAALKNAVSQAVTRPEQLSELRKSVTEKLAGITDGQCSERIANYLVDHG